MSERKLPSEKVVKILQSKTDMPLEEILSLTEREAWHIVYSIKSTTKRQERKPQNEICFTGFGPSRKKELQEIATSKGLLVVKSVTKNIKILCHGIIVGTNQKIGRALDRGADVISEEDFINRYT